MIALYIVTVFSPVVNADAMQYVSRENEIALKSGHSDQNSDVVNLMNESEIRQEKDIIYSDLPQGTEGKYYGSYLPASQVQFPTVGGYFQFATNYTISSSVIANGVSAFWLRVPVIPSQYQYWHLFCSWDSVYVEFFAMPGNSVVLQATYPVEVAKLSLPWYIGGYYYRTLYPSGGSSPGFGSWDNNAPGNYWSLADNESSPNIIQTQNGLYIFLQGVFKPNTQFTLSFTGRLFDNLNPNVFLTAETETVNESQSFRFFEPYLYINPDHIIIDDFGFSYDLTKTIPLKPAWDFVFISGIGKEGLLSYILEFNNQGLDRATAGSTYAPYPNLFEGSDSQKVKQLYFRQTIDKTHMGATVDPVYFSFYMPFTVLRTNESDMDNKISWDVTITIVASGINSARFNNSGIYYTSLILTVTDTENYLLFSAPYPITTLGFPFKRYDWSYVNIIINIAPIENCTLKLLAHEPSSKVIHGFGMSFQSAFSSPYYSSFRSDIKVGGLILPLFNDMFLDIGLITLITPSKLYNIYDFGWGKGYEIRGNTTLYFFLDDGGRFFLTASQKAIIDSLKTGGSGNSSNDPLKPLWDVISGAITSLAGFIYDGITYIWNAIVGVATWIYNVVSEIVGWIISVIADIVDKVGNIVEGVLYGFPIMSVLFIVYYAGRYFSTGNIPNPVKEGRKLKRRLVRIQKRVSKAMPHTTAEAKFIKSKTITPAYEKAKGYAPRGRIERRVERMSYRKTHPAEYTYNRVTTGHQARKQSRKWRRERRGAE